MKVDCWDLDKNENKGPAWYKKKGSGGKETNQMNSEVLICYRPFD